MPIWIESQIQDNTKLSLWFQQASHLHISSYRWGIWNKDLILTQTQSCHSGPPRWGSLWWSGWSPLKGFGCDLSLWCFWLGHGTYTWWRGMNKGKEVVNARLSFYSLICANLSLNGTVQRHDLETHLEAASQVVIMKNLISLTGPVVILLSWGIYLFKKMWTLCLHKSNVDI